MAFGMWLAGILYALVYVYAWALPAGSLLQRGQSEPLPGHLPPFSDIPMDAYLTAGGIALLVAAPWLTAGVAALDARAARALLGPSRAEELEYQVERLAQTRAGVVDAADTERRRLSGTCTTALSSGWSRSRCGWAWPAPNARTRPRRTGSSRRPTRRPRPLSLELRHLVRGLHPAVLEDRGLDAALSGVAARLPIRSG